MNSPLARYLRDFGAESTPADVHFEAPAPVAVMPDLPALDEVAEPVDLEAERRQAYDEGFTAATDQLTAEHAEALAELQKKHAEEMDAQRQAFEGGLADYLAQALPELSTRISSELVDATLRLLAPLLKQQADRQAVEELADELKQTLAKDVLEQIHVTGPEHLCDLLRDRLEEAGERVEFHHSEGSDLKVEIGDSLLVTRLSAFAADLEKVLA